MHPWQQLQDAHGETEQAPEYLQSHEGKKAGDAGKDHDEIRYTAAHEQKHTG